MFMANLSLPFGEYGALRSRDPAEICTAAGIYGNAH
jgi:hypothetical protein